ncbi:MAG: PAS domain S-box protein [Candidatus Acidiferrum sp.]|jgi:PAS domain S-box-containing protein
MTASLAAQKKPGEPFEGGRDLFEALFECVSETVVVSDDTGCIVRVNPQVEKLFGYTRDELRGQPIEMLVPERFRQTHLGHRQHYHQDPRRRAMNTGLELCGRHKDGRELLIDVMLCPLERGEAKLVLSLIHDLSERDTGEGLRFHLAALVNSSGDAIIGKTLDGFITNWNQSAQRIFGYSAEEVIGRPMSMLLPPGREDEESDILGRLKKGETIQAYDAVRRRKDGRDVDVSVTISPIFGPMGNLVGASQAARDITEHKRTAQALQVSEIRYRRLFETSQDGILILDFATGQVMDVNQFLIDMLGYSHSELAGKKLWEIGPVKDIFASRSAFADLQTKGVVHYEDLPLETKDGRRKEVEFVSNVYTVDDEPVIQCNIRDITERKQIERELEISRAQAVSSAHLSALGMMAGNIAHEINNPLAIIHASASNLLEMAESGTVPLNELQNASAHIKQTAERISKIVKSLRQIARDGSADPFQRASVGEIVEHALELCKERFRVHSVRLDTSLVDTRLHVSCREVQIAQVLLNLLQNAFDAAADLPSDRWVRLDVSAQNHSVVFSVSDNGPGVPPEIKSRIMEPFFTTKPVGKGTGLGLSLSRTIVEEHGGQLKLDDSSTNTTFSFSIPLLMEEKDATQERYNIARG